MAGTLAGGEHNQDRANNQEGETPGQEEAIWNDIRTSDKRKKRMNDMISPYEYLFPALMQDDCTLEGLTKFKQLNLGVLLVCWRLREKKLLCQPSGFHQRM